MVRLFLESRPILIPQEDARSIPVLLSDSKGVRLERLHENYLPLFFLCKSGASTKELVDLLLQKLPLLVQAYKKVITVYFWGSTCDQTPREEQHPSPYGLSSRSNSRSLEQGSLQKGPQTKLPTYDGQDDINVFLVPFERIA